MQKRKELSIESLPIEGEVSFRMSGWWKKIAV